MNKIWMKDGKFTELNEEQLKGLPVEELTTYDADRIAAKEAELETMIKAGKAENEEAIKALESSLGDLVNKAVKKNQDAILAIGKALKDLTEKGLSVGSIPAGTLKVLQDKNDQIKAFKASMSGTLEIAIKASHGAVDIDSGTDFATMLAGVGQIPTRRVFMKDIFGVVQTDTEYIKYVDQETKVRDAKNVAACAASTHNSKLTWKVYTIQQKKVRDFTHVCIDMLEDYDFVSSEIDNLIRTDVALRVDEQILLGTGVTTQLDGVASVASTFNAALAGADYSAATGDPIQAPNVGDLICVAGAQISFLGANNKWVANVALINPKTAKLYKLTKDKNDQYLLPSWISPNGEVNVDGIRFIENPLVPENEAYVMDSNYGKIYQKKAATVEMSFENRENFENEMVTVKGYERLNLLIRNVDANAFMHIPDVAAAIVAITKV